MNWTLLLIKSSFLGKNMIHFSTNKNDSITEIEIQATKKIKYIIEVLDLFGQIRSVAKSSIADGIILGTYLTYKTNEDRINADNPNFIGTIKMSIKTLESDNILDSSTAVQHIKEKYEAKIKDMEAKYRELELSIHNQIVAAVAPWDASVKQLQKSLEDALTNNYMVSIDADRKSVKLLTDAIKRELDLKK